MSWQDTPCIPAKGHRNHKGYGVASINGYQTLAHRVAWIRAYGPVPDGMMVCHHCDNPPCVNLEHLFLGTNRDNQLDSVRKGRHKIQRDPHLQDGEKNPFAKLTEAQVREIRALRGKYLQREIAQVYGVSVALVGLVQNRKVWRHIA